MKSKNRINNRQIIEQISNLRNVPPRDLRKATQVRANYIQEIQILARTVSKTGNMRHKVWQDKIQTIFHFRKERFAMSTIAAILLAFTLLVGGTGGTVFAAQSSLPDELLFPVKTWSEDIRLQLASNPQSELALMSQFMDRRITEISSMAEQDEVIPPEAFERFQDQIQQAIHIVASMEDAPMIQELLQLEQQIQTQEKIMQQVQVQDPQSSALMTQTRSMLQNQLQLLENGIMDPLAFRERVNNPNPNVPSNEPGIPQGPGPENAPGTENGQGQNPNETQGTNRDPVKGSDDDSENGQGNQGQNQDREDGSIPEIENSSNDSSANPDSNSPGNGQNSESDGSTQNNNNGNNQEPKNSNNSGQENDNSGNKGSNNH
jgi:hypothetical protein